LAWVRDGESLGAWLADAAALGLARAELPLLARAFRAAAREDYALLAQWNEWVLAGKGTRETYREEVELGGALARFARDQGLAEGFFREGARAGTPGLPWGHVALFAVLGAALGLKEPEAPALLATFLWSYFENAVAAAAKGVPLGQRESQRALLKLAPTVPGTVRAALEVADGEIGSSLPLLAIASARHEESESRMFRG
jgi:urease accessory protein